MFTTALVSATRGEYFVSALFRG